MPEDFLTMTHVAAHLGIHERVIQCHLHPSSSPWCLRWARCHAAKGGFCHEGRGGAITWTSRSRRPMAAEITARNRSCPCNGDPYALPILDS
jgi:hypothetical protein